MKKPFRVLLYLPVLSLLTVFVSGCQPKIEAENRIAAKPVKDTIAVKKTDSTLLDTVDYNKRVNALKANDTTGRWDIKTPYPLPGAVLPYKRVVAFYGNLFSKKMGILGQLPKDQMLKKLQEETRQWALADTTIPTIPAL